MTTTTETSNRNGVDVATLFATIDAVSGQREIAKFQFRADNVWVNGTHSRSTFDGFATRSAGRPIWPTPPHASPVFPR
jgi:hypothetical protein